MTALCVGVVHYVLPTPRIHEVVSAVLLVMVWPYLTMIFIYDKL